MDVTKKHKDSSSPAGHEDLRKDIERGRIKNYYIDKQSQESHPNDFVEMLKMLRDHPQNIPNKRVKAYVAMLLRENSKKTYCAIQKPAISLY